MPSDVLGAWGMELGNSFSEVGAGVGMFLPKLIIAIIIFIAGWFVAVMLGKVVAQIVKAVKVDALLKSVGADEVLARGGFHLDAGGFIGALIKWFIIIVFLIAALDVVGLSQVNEFLREVVLGYLPNVLGAVLILLLAAVIADVMQKLVAGSAKAASVEYAHFLGGVTRWAIWIFAFVIALDKLGLLQNYGVILFQGLVYMFVIAGGLAFGLGGKDTAARFLENMRKHISKGD